MVQALLNALFGCSHKRTSFPLTPVRRTAPLSTAAVRNGTYVVCLDCGKEFAYNWSNMRLGEPMEGTPARPQAQPSFR
jgi:hypothetical protein